MMKLVTTQVMVDQADQDMAQIIHRLGVTKVTVEKKDVVLEYYPAEEVNDDEAEIDWDIDCPDCGSKMVWDERVKDYRHLQADRARGCWLNRNVPKASGD